jgi:hypothetical protein
MLSTLLHSAPRAFYERNPVERYKRNEIEIVIPIGIRSLDRSESDNFHLVLSAIPYRGGWHREWPSKSMRLATATPHNSGHWSDEFVLIPITQFVQCPQEIIASSVRLESAKERLDFFREISGTSNRTLHVGDIPRERERRIFGVGFPGHSGDGISCHDENASQVGKQVLGELTESFWKRHRQFYLVNLPARLLRLQVGFNNSCVWIEVVELPDSPVQIGQEIFLSPTRVSFVN